MLDRGSRLAVVDNVQLEQPACTLCTYPCIHEALGGDPHECQLPHACMAQAGDGQSCSIPHTVGYTIYPSGSEKRAG